MADTIVDLPKLRLWLAEAEMAQHNLAMGKGPQSVGYDGKNVSYTVANRDDLAIWINTLKARIAALDGTPFARRRPVYLSF